MITQTTRQSENIPPAIAAEDRSDLPLQQTALLARLRELAPEIEQMGVDALYLFGSYARGEADAYSDIDVFVEPAPHFSLVELVRVQHLIEAAVDVHVDVTTRNSLGTIRAVAERDAIRVF